MGWPTIDFAKLISQNIPAELNAVKERSWLEALLAPMVTLNAEFVDYRARVLREMQYNGQTIILENMLNDFFDVDSRGIWIETVEAVDSQVYIAQPEENAPTYIGQQEEDELVYIGQQSESYALAYDFIVHVPDGILTAQEEVQLKALTRKYKLASKRPRFQYFNGLIF